METQLAWRIKVHIYVKMLQFSCHRLAFLTNGTLEKTNPWCLQTKLSTKERLPPTDLVLYHLTGRKLSGCVGILCPPSPHLSFTRPVSNRFFPNAHPARSPLAGLCLLKADSPRCINRECRAEEPRRVEATLPLFVWMLLQRPGTEELCTSTADTLGRWNVSFVLAQGWASVTKTYFFVSAYITIISVIFSCNKVHCTKIFKYWGNYNPIYDDNEVLGGTLVNITTKRGAYVSNRIARYR